MKVAISPRWIASITSWLASAEAREVTGRVFDVRGESLSIAEGWHQGPVATQPDDPTELKSVVADLMAKARPNANMSGQDYHGDGFPPASISELKFKTSNVAGRKARHVEFSEKRTLRRRRRHARQCGFVPTRRPT